MTLAAIRKQALFTLQCAKFSQILRELYSTHIVIVLVAQWQVGDVYKFTLHLNPEWSAAFLSTLEIIQNLVYYMHAVRRVAHTDIPAEYSPVPVKNPVLPLCEKLYLIVFIYESNVSR